MRSYNYLLFFVAHDLHRSRRFPSHFTCLSDNMFGLIAGSDIQRIPSAGTPLYTDTHSAVRLASSLSEEFTIKTGVKQGCIIAHDLFNCVIDHLMHRMLRRCSLGLQLGEYKLTDLDYADDIAIFAPSACMLQEALIILQEEANLVGIQSWL